MSTVIGRSKDYVFESDYVNKGYRIWAQKKNLALSNEYS